MFATDHDPDEIEDLDEPPDELDEEEEDEDPLDDDEEEAASLDELLAQRAAARRTADDDGDIMSLVSEPDDYVWEPVVTRVAPAKHRQEFVCNRCRLVKATSQLADPQRGLCRDCV
ncbi:MAG: DUF4193 family protein [Actinomycetota bacterium]